MTVLDMPTDLLPDRRLPPELYQQYMDANFRRSGRLVYQPVCDGCRACRQLRVLVDRFQRSASQHRVWKRNADLRVAPSPPKLTDEKLDLWTRYMADQHDRGDENDAHALERFLYDSPTKTIEFEYRLPDATLAAVGICDVGDAFLSSVYFYYSPEHRRRSLGVFGVLRELEWCRAARVPHYYLGYWVEASQKMGYKANYRPHEVLRVDGTWEAKE